MQEFKAGDIVKLTQETIMRDRPYDCWKPWYVALLSGGFAEVEKVEGGSVVLAQKEYATLRKEDIEFVKTKQPIQQDKQISIERVGDKTSVTISGHLTKDDVQSILNLIFL